MVGDTHAALGEAFEIDNSQRYLHDKAGRIHEVRGPRTTTPGAKKTTPSLTGQGSFYPDDPLYTGVIMQIAPPLPQVNQNPQDAVHREGNESASDGGYNRASAPQARKHIIGAGGTNVQQIVTKQAEMNPISHPMAGGVQPPKIDVANKYDQGERPYFPVAGATNQVIPSASNKTPVNTAQNQTKINKKVRDTNIRRPLSMKKVH
jgi:hypothetical protein